MPLPVQAVVSVADVAGAASAVSDGGCGDDIVVDAAAAVVAAA